MRDTQKASKNDGPAQHPAYPRPTLLEAFLPSWLWAPSSADRTLRLPTPPKLSSLPQQVFHPYFPTFPSAGGVSQPHLPPAPLGPRLSLKVSIPFLPTRPPRSSSRTHPECPHPASDSRRRSHSSPYPHHQGPHSTGFFLTGSPFLGLGLLCRWAGGA